MNEEQIIALAQGEVAARRARHTREGWAGPWSTLPPLLVLVVLSVFVAAPGPLPQKLLRAMGGVCSLRPSHSYFAGGVQLPLESRMMGIYGGFMLTFALLLLLRRAGARRLASKPVVGLLAVMFASMVFDGINSTLREIGGPTLYAPSNLARLLTGLLAGIALAPFLLWLIGLVAVPPTGRSAGAIIHNVWELLAAIALCAGFALLVIDGSRALYYPLALTAVSGIVMTLAGSSLLPILVIGGLEGRIQRARDLVAPGAIALLAAFSIVAATAALRWSVIGSM